MIQGKHADEPHLGNLRREELLERAEILVLHVLDVIAQTAEVFAAQNIAGS